MAVAATANLFGTNNFSTHKLSALLCDLADTKSGICVYESCYSTLYNCA